MTASEKNEFLLENGISVNFALWIIDAMEKELYSSIYKDAKPSTIEYKCKVYHKRIYNQIFPLMYIQDARYVEEQRDYVLAMIRMYASGCVVYDAI